MDRQINISVFSVLEHLAQRIEPSTHSIQFLGKPVNINVGKRWDFYIAIADTNAYHDEFKQLLDKGMIATLPGQRTYDDWRKHFPEYHYKITELGQDVLKNPAKYVEVPPY